ncbi:MAG: phospholipase D family protein [Gemmataceae bacterium]
MGTDADDRKTATGGKRLARLLVLLVLLALLGMPARAAPSITVAFSPRGGATEAVIGVIDEARHTIHVAAYAFTSRPVAAALVAAHGRGVEVAAVLDRSNETASRSAAALLVRSGVPVRTADRYAIMHSKFLVVDGATVQTGSFNYTAAAERQNAENVLVLRGHPDVAAAYERQWRRLWDESRAFRPAARTAPAAR